MQLQMQVIYIELYETNLKCKYYFCVYSNDPQMFSPKGSYTSFSYIAIGIRENRSISLSVNL